MIARVAILALIVCFVGNVSLENVEKMKNEKFSQVKRIKPECLKSDNSFGCGCSMCEEVTGFIRTMILSHKVTEEQIINKVCDRVFKSSDAKRKICIDIAENELKEILKYTKEINPEKCCKRYCPHE